MITACKNNNAADIIVCCAEFKGPKEVTDAICERLLSLNDILFAHQQDYRRTNTYASHDWVPGIFKPEANLYQYSLVQTTKDGVTATLDPDQNGNCNLYVVMDGPDEQIINLCNDICELTGITCDITGMTVVLSADADESEQNTLFASIKPEKAPVKDINSILFSIPTDEEVEALRQNPKPKWTVGLVEEKLLGSQS